MRTVARAGARQLAAQLPRAPGPLPTGSHEVLAPQIGEPVPMHLPTGPDGKPLSPQQIADRILASLLSSSGPILLCMPGTNGAYYQNAIRETARAFIRLQPGAPLAIASIPYPNAISDIFKRFAGRGMKPEENVLALVLEGLAQRAPGRPVYLVSESQGSWVSTYLLQNPDLARTITRAVMFSRPGFTPRPPSTVADAAAGAGRILEIRHTDDIVPSAVRRAFTPQVIGSMIDAVCGWLATGDYEYVPHHYDVHGEEAARFLLDGEVPRMPVHRSEADGMYEADNA